MLHTSDELENPKLDMPEGAVIARTPSRYLRKSAANDSVNLDNLNFSSGTNVRQLTPMTIAFNLNTIYFYRAEF